MPLDINKLKPGKKIFFASDFHLGAPNHEESLLREKKIVNWLDEIKGEAEIIILAGDLFDFWTEFVHVIPKGFARLQGKLAEITDSGVRIAVFPGNHDMWMYGYFEKELGVEVYHNPESFRINDKIFYLGHGDGLGPGDRGYKLINRFMFKNKLLRVFFRWINPNFGMWIGISWSKSSFKKKYTVDQQFFGEKEWLYRYCLDIEAKTHHDYYIFGHRHLQVEMKMPGNSFYINLGEWLSECNYAVFDGSDFLLKKYTGSDSIPAIEQN